MARRSSGPPSRPNRAKPARRARRASSQARRTEASTPADERPPATRPDVILDFHLDRGLLHVVLRNIGHASAYDVVTRFDRTFKGLGGKKEISTLTLFRGLPFLAPGRQFVQLVDSMNAYVQRKEPTRLTATISYKDRDGKSYKETIPHDLEIYRDLAEALTR